MTQVSTDAQIAEAAARLYDRFTDELERKHAGDQETRFYCLLSPDQQCEMGMSSRWSVIFEDRKTRERFPTPLSICLPPEVRFAAFRDAFENLGLKLDHPYAVTIYGTMSEQCEDPGRRFIPGEEVTVTHDSPVLLRPSGAPVDTTWLSAEIRLFTSDRGEHLVGCNIDPCSTPADEALGRERDRANRFNELSGFAAPPTFYVFLSYEGQHRFIPVAQVTGFDAASGAYTFQLDKRVELKR